MEIKAIDVAKLRKMTGAGMMDCKKALVEAEGDFTRAQEIIREKGTEDAPEDQQEPLRQQLRRAYTPLQGFCMMLFCLLSIPCLATLAIIRKELNSWKWMFFEAAGLFALAYVTTLVVYRLGLLLKIGTDYLL